MYMMVDVEWWMVDVGWWRKSQVYTQEHMRRSMSSLFMTPFLSSVASSPSSRLPFLAQSHALVRMRIYERKVKNRMKTHS